MIHMIRKFDFNDDTRSSVPTLETWLYSLKLEELMEVRVRVRVRVGPGSGSGFWLAGEHAFMCTSKISA